MSRRPIFTDQQLQEQFDKHGYVKVPLLKMQEVQKLIEFYQTLNNDHVGDYGFHVSLDNEKHEFVSKVVHTIEDLVKEKAKAVFKDFQLFTASFVVKEPGLQNVVPPHQDWTFVDESQYTSVTVWIPLQDVDSENGALGFIKGSHRFFDYPRCSPSPQSPAPLADHYVTLFPYISVIEMKAGEALIFSNKLIHASPPNITNQARVAVGFGVTHQEAELIHYYEVPGKEPKQVEKYVVTKDFFLQYNNKNLGKLFDKGERPRGWESAGVFPQQKYEISEQEMLDLVKSHSGNTYNQKLVQSLAGLYNYNTDGSKKASEPKISEQEIPANQYIDTRSFLEKYTPTNILAEIKYRIKKAVGNE